DDTEPSRKENSVTRTAASSGIQDQASTAAMTSSETSKLAYTFCTSSQSSMASISLKTLRAPSSSSGTVTLGTKDDSADSYSMLADWRAVRTAIRSPGSETTSKASPRSLTSSAPASRTAVSTSSSD